MVGGLASVAALVVLVAVVAGLPPSFAQGPDALTAPEAKGYATLRLDSNGTLAGSTGCRTLTGSHVVLGGEILATRLGADGECSPALADQDGHIFSVLGDGFRADVDGDPRGARGASQGVTSPALAAGSARPPIRNVKALVKPFVKG